MSLFGWTLLAMVAMFSPGHSLWRFVQYQQIATAIDVATDDPDDASLLASVGSFESGYDPNARGKLGEQGTWQLRWSPCPDYRVAGQDALNCQAREALRRWHQQGACGYTGEAARAPDCPLARNREQRARRWSDAHPFEVASR